MKQLFSALYCKPEATDMHFERCLKKIISASLLCMLILSCKDSKNNRPDNQIYELETVNKDLKFAIDEDTKFQFPALFPYTDLSGKEYLTFLSHLNNSILFYDLPTGEYLFNVTLEREGPAGVGIVFGYHIEDFDNIYLTSYYAAYPGLMKVDTSGTKKQFIAYGTTSNGFKIISNFRSSSFIYKPAVIHNGKIYITQDLYPGAKKSDIPVSIAIDTLSQTFEELPFRYPKLITDNTSMEDIVGVPFSREFDGTHFIYSFYMDKNIYITDLATNEERKIPVQSKYINHLKPIKITDDREMAYKASLESSYYHNILYDKYRNVYYRFAIIGSDMTNHSKYSFFDIYANGYVKFSVIILDKDFNIIGETLFPKYTYNPDIAFVHKNGLYISDTHILNPSFDENVLSFKCFTLKESK
jgi:hypothetical protein